MTDQHTSQHDDVTRYLAGGDDLSGLYQQGSTEQTPAHLSARIREMAAQDMAASQPTRIGLRKGYVWAMAASVMIAVMTVLWIINLDKTTQPTVTTAAQNPPQPIQVQPAPETVVENNTQQHTVTPVEQLVQTTPAQNKPKPSAPPLLTPPEKSSTPVSPQPSNVQDVASDQRHQDFLQPARREIPLHLGEGLPPDAELRTWNVEKWISTIKQAQTQSNNELADKYIKAFPYYHPQQDIQALLK